MQASSEVGAAEGVRMDVLRRAAWWGTLATAAVILVGTLTPALTVPGRGCMFGVPCALGHALLFGGLGVGLAGLFVTSRSARRAPQRALVMLFLGLWIFAAATELLQAQVGRDASLEDWIADMVGAMGGLLAGGLGLRWFWGDRLAAAVAEPATGPGGGRRRRGRR